MGKKRAPQTYGYIRVSSKDQNEDRQQIAMIRAGVKRKNILQRQREGIEAARLRGVHMGRPRQDSEDLENALSLYISHQIPLKQAVDMSGFSRSGFYKRLHEASQVSQVGEVSQASQVSQVGQISQICDACEIAKAGENM